MLPVAFSETARSNAVAAMVDSAEADVPVLDVAVVEVAVEDVPVVDVASPVCQLLRSVPAAREMPRRNRRKRSTMLAREVVRGVSLVLELKMA
jgi:hypothetical protein